jgi:guanylate kinase
MNQAGKIIILAGPSGSGKTTIAAHLLQHYKNLSFSTSATTRPKRQNETDGKDYHFLSKEDFEASIAKNDFVEYEEVYKGIYYGTLKSEIESIWEQQQIPVLDIDVYGALNIKKNFAPKGLSLFVHPVTIENIKNRLRQRATESEESYEKRVHKAGEELEKAIFFDEIIYNNKLEDALVKTEKIVEKYMAA